MMNTPFIVDPEGEILDIFTSMSLRFFSSENEVNQALDEKSSPDPNLWITNGLDAYMWVAKAETSYRSAKTSYPMAGKNLLLGWVEAEPFQTSVTQALASMFHRHILIQKNLETPDRLTSFLSPEEIGDVIQDENSADFCIGGSVIPELGMLHLYRGDLSDIWIPLSVFTGNTRGSTTDISNFEVIDFGRTLRFGEYEAAFDAVLYERDPDYRRRIKRQRLAEDSSFGAALRRLRKQKGLSRSDFLPDLNEKTIARIERGEVAQPHPNTLVILGKKLGVDPNTIQDY